MRDVIAALKKLDLPAHERLALEYIDDVVIDTDDIEDVIRELEETDIAAGSGIASDLMFTDKVYEWVREHVEAFDEVIRSGLLEGYGYRSLVTVVWVIIELGARDLAARLRGEL